MTSSSRLIIILLALALVTISGLYWNASQAQESPSAAAEEEEPELAAYMADLQYFTQKLILAAEAENQPLSDFYLHEVEELSEEIEEDVPEYEGHAIGELTGSMLIPQIEALEERLDTEDWTAVAAEIDNLVQACNNCHAATDHGFIHITTEPTRTFNQDFSVREP